MKKRNFFVTLASLMLGIPLMMVGNNKHIKASATDDNILNPLSHYEFLDETDLGKDSMGNNNLIAVGSPTATEGVYNFAANSYLRAQDDAAGNDFTDLLTDYTISFNLKRDVTAAPFAPILSTGNSVYCGSGNILGGIEIYAAYGNVSVNRNLADKGDTQIIGPCGVNTDSFTNLIFSYDSTNEKLNIYAAGELVKTIESSFPIAGKDMALCLGGNFNTYSDTVFEGGFVGDCEISDLRIYDACLSVKNIGRVASGGDALLVEPPVTPFARYEFADSQNLGKDSIGSNDLVAVGSPTATNGVYNFDADSYLRAQDDASGIDFTDSFTDYSISFNVKRDVTAAPFAPILSTGNSVYCGSSGIPGGIEIYAAYGNVSVNRNLSDKGDLHTLGACGLSPDHFVNLTFTYNSTAEKFAVYSSGELVTTLEGTYPLGGQDMALCLGASFNTYSDSPLEGGFAGDCALSDLRIYDVTLTADEVKNLNPVTSISLNKEETSITIGGTEALVPTVLPEYATNKAITWESTDESVATVTAAGVVAAVKEGTATITAKSASGLSATCTVTVTDIPEVETDLDALPLVRYEFKDSSNPGKDSMGHFDLVSYGTPSISNESYNLSSTACLHSQDNADNTDFTDYLGDYSISFNVKRDVLAGDDAWHPILATGNGGYLSGTSRVAGIAVYASYGNMSIVRNTVESPADTNIIGPCGINASTFTNIVLSYSELGKALSVYANGELVGTILKECPISGDLMALCLGGAWNTYSDSLFDNFVGECALSDVRIYDFALSKGQVKHIADGETPKMIEGNVAISSIDLPSIEGIEFDRGLTNEQILTNISTLCPATTTATLTDESSTTVNLVWKDAVIGQNSVSVKGFPFNNPVSNMLNKSVEIEIPFVDESKMVEFLPLAHYEFKDPSNLGKDSMGNWDLKVDGTGLAANEAGELLFDDNFNGMLTGENYLDESDFSDYIGSFTISFDVKKDISGAEAWEEELICTGDFLHGVHIQGAAGKITAFIGGTNNFAQTENVTSIVNANTYSNITVTYDKATGLLSVYLNGVLSASNNVGTSFGLGDGANQPFVIGCNAFNDLSSGGARPVLSGSMKDVRVYGFAMPQQNILVTCVNKAEKSVAPANYLVSVDEPEVNTVVDSTNTIASIGSALPTTLEGTTNKGTDTTVNVSWVFDVESNEYIGFISSDESINLNEIILRQEIKYAVKFTSDDHSSINDVKVNGETTSGDLALSEGDVVTFKVSASKNYEVSKVTVNGNEITAVNGVYSVTVNGFKDVKVETNPVSYEIIYNTNSIDGVVRRYYTVETDSITLYTPEKEGHTFVGWYKTSDFTGEKVTELDPSACENVTLYAKYEVNSYTVTYKFNDEVLATEKVNYGEKITKETFEKDGYTFGGLFTDEACTVAYNKDSAISGDVTVYVKMNKNNPEKTGCFGSIIASSALISICAFAGLGLAINKKNKKK